MPYRDAGYRSAGYRDYSDPRDRDYSPPRGRYYSPPRDRHRSPPRMRRRSRSPVWYDDRRHPSSAERGGDYTPYAPYPGAVPIYPPPLASAQGGRAGPTPAYDSRVLAHAPTGTGLGHHQLPHQSGGQRKTAERRKGPAEPSPNADIPEWTRYLNAHPELLRSHVRRDDRDRVEDENVRGYVWVNRMSYLESVIRDVRMRKRTRTALFRRFAALFSSAEHYQGELERVGVTPANRFSLTPYNGNIPPMDDDAIQHAARCGITPSIINPPLTTWAAAYRSSDSTLGMAVQPANTQPGQAEAQTPAASVHGSGAATPRGETTTTSPAAPEPGPSHVTERDVEMGDSTPAN